MTRKLNPSVTEFVFKKTSNRVHVPKKYIGNIADMFTESVHVTKVNDSFIVSKTPSPKSKSYSIDKDGAVRIRASKDSYEIMTVGDVVVLI